MKAPAKIYLQRGDDLKAGDGHWEGETWCADAINENDVEYIRADLVKARIKRAKKGGYFAGSDACWQAMDKASCCGEYEIKRAKGKRGEK